MYQQLDSEPQDSDVCIVCPKIIDLYGCSAMTDVFAACMRNVLSWSISLCLSSLRMTCPVHKINEEDVVLLFKVNSWKRFFDI